MIRRYDQYAIDALAALRATDGSEAEVLAWHDEWMPAEVLIECPDWVAAKLEDAYQAAVRRIYGVTA